MDEHDDVRADEVRADEVPADDVRLLDELRAGWEATDPAPADLAERVLFALQLEDLDTEFELLRMTERTDALVGTRSATQRSTSDATHITFAGEEMTVMLAVAADPAGGDQRRIDGWVAPLVAARFVLHTAEGRREAEDDGTGRFVLQDVPAGLVRLLVHPADGAPFVTPAVEI